jgi:hypothetical protein
LVSVFIYCLSVGGECLGDSLRHKARARLGSLALTLRLSDYSLDTCPTVSLDQGV